ncbi:unnamed protein product [Chrysoparadoxa australica]
MRGIAALFALLLASAQASRGNTWTSLRAPGSGQAVKTLRGGEVLPPPAVYANVVGIGTKKASLPLFDLSLLSVLSGIHISFGGLLALTVGGNMPGIASANPGLQKILLGVCGLPFGLYMVLLNAGELFTGNTSLLSAAYIEKTASFTGVSRVWIVSFLGNLLGSLFMVKIADLAGIITSPAGSAGVALAKVSESFLTCFLRGMLCNWMVCMAIWIAVASSTLTEKFLAMVLPVSAFVAFGGEHSVANMFLVPMGMAMGADVTWADFLTKNLLPVTLGNIVGGVVCQTMPFAAIFGSLVSGK